MVKKLNFVHGACRVRNQVRLGCGKIFPGGRRLVGRESLSLYLRNGAWGPASPTGSLMVPMLNKAVYGVPGMYIIIIQNKERD